MLKKVYPQAEFIAVQYKEDPPDVTGEEVIIADFSYPYNVLQKMCEKAISIVILDHHKSAKEDLSSFKADNCKITFDMEKSGARLAWEYCHGDKQAPWQVDYTEDRDLWRHELAFTKEINAAIQSHPFDHATWDDLDPNELVKEGRGILRFMEQQIDSAVNNKFEVELLGHKVLATNVAERTLISDVGNRLSIDRPFGITWFTTADKLIFSLRSSDKGEDVGSIAKSLGGGGHRNAASFSVPCLGSVKAVLESMYVDV